MLKLEKGEYLKEKFFGLGYDCIYLLFFESIFMLKMYKKIRNIPKGTFLVI